MGLRAATAHAAGRLGARRDDQRADWRRERTATILERRDVALVAVLALAGVSLMTAVGLLLRPGDRGSDAALLAWSLLLTVVCGGLALAIDRPVVRRLLGRTTTYVVVFAATSTALGLLAVDDGGLSNVHYAANVATGTYVGLVLAGRWAWAPLPWMLAVAALVTLAGPGDSAVDAVAVVVLACAGWGLGRLGHLAFDRAAQDALVASRSDALTATLNRRGFFEQLDYELAERHEPDAPLSLLVLDLNGFKQVNDEHGHAAGDELLRWIGEVLPQVVPGDATVGRLGGDEFAIVLPAVDGAAAAAIGEATREALAPRIAVAVGVATAAPGDRVDADELVRAADGLMYVDKRGLGRDTGAAPGRSARLEADGDRRGGRAGAGRRERPPITYAVALRRGRDARSEHAKPPPSVHRMNCAGTAAIVLCSLSILWAQHVYGAPSAYTDAGLLLALPWVLCNVVLAAVSLRWGTGPGFARAWRIHYFASAALLGGALWIGMLASSAGGIASPLVGGMFLKIIYDGFALEPSQARLSTLAMLGWWAAAAVVGPADQLWVVPFQLSMFAASWAVGRVAHRAQSDMTEEILELAAGDPLTGLRNRDGYDGDLRRAISSARSDGGALAVLALDLDDFKSINDRLGHEAGDDVLRAVTQTLRRVLPAAHAIGRVGGDEFTAAVTLPAAEEAPALAAHLARELRPIVGASVGYAVLGEDGEDASALTQAADARSYAVKREGPSRSQRLPATSRNTATRP